ncbi:major facilitator superfamily domain-containing protein [Obelidium mucronatum]|nr:major facilitator superfamily domain-containing protein [Obelidium mucronatum]
MAKEVRKVIVAQKMMPQTAKPSRFQNVITAEETGGGGDEEKGAPKNEDTVKNAAAKKVQFQVIASMASKQASRTQTAPSKNPSDSSKPQNKLMIFSDDNLNESLPSGGMPLLPKQQDARRLSIESRPVTAESYQSKATSAGLFSATSLQWIQDDIMKSKRAKTPQTIRSGKNMSNSSLQRLNSVSRGPSVRPCMPGGHHDEAAISRMTSVKKKISPTQTQQVTLESEQMLGSMSTDDFSDIHEELVSAWDILKSPVFWLYACTCIFQQGTAYMTNVSSILYSIYSLTNTQTEINDMTTRHVTYMSLFQAGAMFSFGVLSDYLESLHIVWLDRTVLMFLSQLILFAPNVVLMTSDTSDGAILFCSICTGLGFGASSCLLPILTQDFFGLQFFGTAVGFAMTGVPIGILLCNSIFGILYDKQLATQNATAITSSITCYGSICYQQSFQVFTGIQTIAVVTSLLLLLLRLKQRYAHRHEHHKSLEELNT